MDALTGSQTRRKCGISAAFQRKTSKSRLNLRFEMLWLIAAIGGGLLFGMIDVISYGGKGEDAHEGEYNVVQRTNMAVVFDQNPVVSKVISDLEQNKLQKITLTVNPRLWIADWPPNVFELVQSCWGPRRGSRKKNSIYYWRAETETLGKLAD